MMGVHLTGDRELFQCDTALFMENVSPSHADALIKRFAGMLQGTLCDKIIFKRAEAAFDFFSYFRND